MARGRDADEFWQIPFPGWRDILARTWWRIGENNLSLLAAGVAFYSFLAFVPLLAAVVLLYGIFADPATVGAHIAILTRLLPADAAKIIADQLRSMTATPASRTTIGLILAIMLALYGAMRGASAIISALNIAYAERETRSLFRTYGLSLVFTAGSVIAAVLAILAISAMGLLGGVIRLPSLLEPVITVGLWITTACSASALIAIIYRYGPDRKNARWTWLTPGALFASFGTLIATLLFGVYVSHFAKYNATYGALGAVVSFLMWLYVAAFVILLGAEINAEIEHQTAHDTTVGPARPQGYRGAIMADTTAGVSDGLQQGDQTAPSETLHSSAVSFVEGLHGRPSIASDFNARRILAQGGLKIGPLPVALLVGGLTLLGRRERVSAGLLCVCLAAVSARYDIRRCTQSPF